MEWMVTGLFAVIFLWMSYRIGIGFDFGLPTWTLPTLLLIKFLCGGIVYFIFTEYYPIRSDADIFKYYDDAIVLYNYMSLEPASISHIMIDSDVPVDVAPRLKAWYAGSGFKLFDSSQIMVKIHVFLRLISFGYFHVHSICFSFLSFWGCVCLLKSMKLYSNANMWLALGALLLPSFQLWSSAPLKESVAVCMLLVAVSVLWDYLHTGNHRKWITMAMAMLALYVFKPFFVLIMLPCVIMTLLIKIPSAKKYLIFAALSLLFLWIADPLLGSMSPIDLMARKQSDFHDALKFQSVPSMSPMPILQPDMIGLIKLLPYAFMNAFLKPFPWDSMNPLYLASAFENLMVLCMFLMLVIRLPHMSDVANKRFVVFVMVFTIMSFLMLGYSCPIIGSLMRYKSPLLVLIPSGLLISGVFAEKNRRLQ